MSKGNKYKFETTDAPRGRFVAIAYQKKRWPKMGGAKRFSGSRQGSHEALQSGIADGKRHTQTVERRLKLN